MAEGKAAGPENGEAVVLQLHDAPVAAAAPVAASGGRGKPGVLRRFFQDYRTNLRERPVFMLLLPMLTFCVLCALSVAGVVLGADGYEAESRLSASSTALDWAASFRLSAEKIFTPLVTLAILIKQNPQLAGLEAAFPTIARQLLRSVNGERTVIQELQLSPMGVISMIYPKNNDTDTRLGINIFKQPALRGGALNTIKQREVVMNGPLKLVQGNFGTIARIPIFIANSSASETFGTNMTLPYDCTSLCYNETSREKLWGFATAIGPLDDLRAGNDSRLDLLKSKGYKWLMSRPYTSTERNDSKLFRPEWTDWRGDYVFANSSAWPSEGAVGSDIDIGNAVWRVYLEPQAGWRPHWEQGAIAAVVLGSLLVSLLVAIIMASWAQQRRLLGDVMESNVQLEDTTSKLQQEKLRLDALLVRQYNLLQVLGGRSGSVHATECGSEHSSISSKEGGLTLDRIESMRRQLAVNSNTSAQDLESIQTTDLLGEGTFGKVYKGLWRGTVVAVKTMLLPANMSGAEKREKMAVMEAAISSSLAHPGIVQTYTYAIRPMRDMGAQGAGDITPPDTIGLPSTDPSSSGIQRSQSSAVHSYEVRLVLEYCDKGCLREALDDGIFLMDDGTLNYLAVLDSAADVAKAMLHLHSLNVLHSDLKARNVMLSSSSMDGRGVVCKVGDFGLALTVSHLETHVSNVYQGTLTHMAPEILLDGRISKAADTYAFGITLWEMYTGGRAFEGVPRALLGHQITREQLRPRFPVGTPPGFQNLVERCWQQNWELRPSFEEILEELLAMRAHDSRPTPPVHVVGRVLMSAAELAAFGTGISRGGSGLTEREGEGGRSYYLEGSVDDSDIIVMRSMTDWSHGASGVSTRAPSCSSMRSKRSIILPQIGEEAEAATEAAAEEGAHS